MNKLKCMKKKVKLLWKATKDFMKTLPVFTDA